jgi:Bacterial regulatory proteins, tetR family
MNSRELLVETMSDLLWERGYADTSPRDVRERSGVGQGSMYHHFRPSGTWRSPPSSATSPTGARPAALIVSGNL